MLPTTMLGGLPRQDLATDGYILTRAISIKVREAEATRRPEAGHAPPARDAADRGALGRPGDRA